MGPDAMILVFWMLSFKLTFSLSSFNFIKRLFSSSSLSAVRLVLSAYLRLLIFLLAILIPACASSSPAFLRKYSAYKLKKQGDNIQPWCTPFPILNQSVLPWRLTRPFRTNSQKRCPFHYRALECKSRKSETPEETGKIGLGVQNEAGQRLTKFCQENTLVIRNTLFQQHKSRLYTRISPDWLYFLPPKMEKLYTVSKNKTRSWLWLRPWTPYCQIQT